MYLIVAGNIGAVYSLVEKKMGIKDKYFKLIEKKLNGDTETAGRLIQIGLAYEDLRLRTSGRKKVPSALNLLNRLAIRSVSKALAHPEETVWVNIFAPTELLTAFGLRPLSIESFSAFMGGFRIEDYFLRRAEEIGMSDTLCSYHKCFVGAADTGVLKPPMMSLTTTLACDGNVNTFRYLERRLGVESFVLDVPYEYSEESKKYVSDQLYLLIQKLEEKSGVRFNEDALRTALIRENEAHELQEEALALQATKDYPTSLTLHMFKIFASHVLCGSKETLDYFRMLVEDMKSYPDSNALKILWVQLMPYYQETLKRYLGGSEPARIIASDLDIDHGFGNRLDIDHPIEALAEKVLRNTYNGPFSRKIGSMMEAAKRFEADGVILFCHWGCKQSAGGSMEMKRAFDEEGIPFLMLDGDGVDRRNDAPEQIRTRTEAFFEMLSASRAGGKVAK